MNSAGIAARVARGLGRAGAVLGVQCAIYRPQAPGPALSPRWWMGAVMAGFSNSPVLDFVKPADRNNPAEFGAFDTAGREVGDYLVEPGGAARFIVEIPATAAPQVIRCNDVVDVMRPAQASAGLNPYQADTFAGEAAILEGWPAAVWRGPGGRRSFVGLPGDANLGGVTVLLPNAAALRTGDIVVQGDGTRAVVELAELSPLGWRLSASLAAT